MSRERIQKLCEYIDRNRTKNYPIYNERLAAETDYIKNAYFRMLAVILEQGEDISDAQRNLFERQVAGAECVSSVEDYFRQALEIEVEEYINFTEQCREMEIRYRFLLDALLLMASERVNDAQLRLAANFAEALKIKKEELNYLAQLAKAILEQSASAYVTAEENRISSVPYDTVREYADFLGEVCQNANRTIIRPALSSEMDIEKLRDIIEKTKTPELQLLGTNVSLELYPLFFCDFEKVMIENCVFAGGNTHPVNFKNCGQICIKACTFQNFSSRTIVEEQVGKMTIEDTHFEHCEFRYSRARNDWEPLGGVIYSLNLSAIGKNYYNRCNFVNCGGRNSEYYYSSEIISNCRSELRECRFENCCNYNQGIERDPDSNKQIMFPRDSRVISCEAVDSAYII